MLLVAVKFGGVRDTVYRVIRVGLSVFFSILAVGEAYATSTQGEYNGIPYLVAPVYLTSSNSDFGVISFFNKNAGRIVYVDNTLDFSQALEVHIKTVEACNTPLDAVESGNIKGLPLPLPESVEDSEPRCKGAYLVLHPNDDTLYLKSYGGMGTANVRLKGFFDITTTYHSGPSIYYHLTAVDAPFDVRRAMQETVYLIRNESD